MQPKPTSLEVLEMELRTTIVTLEDKQQGPGDANKDGAPKPQTAGQNIDPKAKDAKPAPYRKRARNLGEDRRFKLFSGTANRALAVDVARHIGITVGEAKLQRFSDGEVYFQLLENVR